jgi:UDP-glucose 4-epimerase
VPSAARFDGGVEWIHGDLSDRFVVRALVQSADYVFHLVSSSTPSTANLDPAGDVLENVIPTVHLLESCKSSAIKKLVFLSSGGTVYGIPSQVPIPETAPTNPISAHGIQKLALEKYFSLYHYLYGVDSVVLRVANPYGPMQVARKGQGVVAALISRALAGGPLEVWGSGDVVRDFIYIDDVIRAILQVGITNATDRLFNVGSGIGKCINDVVDDIETITRCGTLKRIWLAGRAVDVPINVLDIRRIQEATGWAPSVAWSEGLEKTISWMKNAAAKDVT